MLSPGKYHELVPRDFDKNIQYRHDLLLCAAKDKDFRTGCLEMARQDILWWINSLVVQTNPNKDEVGPFITWPFQERAIRKILGWIEEKEDFLVEKSREMGATWLLLIVTDWLRRFSLYHDSLMMSKSALAVDGPSHQSLFGKLRFINRHLPIWVHDPDSFIDQKNYMGYPQTHSTLTGFASTGKAGVSERGSEMLIDEFTQIEEDFEVLHRTSSTTKCRIFIATHMGTGTAFHALTKMPEMNKVQFHWTQHPDKNKGMYRWNEIQKRLEFLHYDEATDELFEGPAQYPFSPDYPYDKTGNPTGGPHPGVRSPWYDGEFVRIGRNLAEMAKDQDINPSGSVSQFYVPLVIRQLIEDCCYPPCGEYELDYDKKTGEPKKLIPAKGGRIKLWCVLDPYGRPPVDFHGAGADISEGAGCTPSCLSFFRAKTGEKVLEFVDPNIKPYEFGVLAVALCRFFIGADGTGAKIAWEHHGPGGIFGNTVWRELKYLRIYLNQNEQTLNFRITETPGFHPRPNNQLILHSDYRQALAERKAINRSKHALEETLNFKHTDRGGVEHTQYRTKDDPSGARENHGDVVVSDALAWKMVKDMAKQYEPESKLIAQPGTLAYLFQEEEKELQRSKELYPNWRGAYRGR